MCASLNSIPLHALILLMFSCQLLAQPTLGTDTDTDTNPNPNPNQKNLTYVTNMSFLIAKNSSCQPQCGSVKIPYPFGIGAGCYFDSVYKINCSDSKPYLGELEVLSFSPGQIRVRNILASSCYNNTGGPIAGYDPLALVDLPLDWPYTFSESLNKFVVVGCHDFGVLVGLTQAGNLSTGCGSACSENPELMDRNCTGIGCCQVYIPKGLKAYGFLLATIENSQVSSIDNCTYAFIGEQDKFNFNGRSDLLDPTFLNRTTDTVPIVLDFGIGNKSCVAAQKSDAYLCQGDNTFCSNNTDGSSGGYLCNCKSGYQGNPYLSPGCTDINECNNTNEYNLILNDCAANANCNNIPGSYYCSCPRHYVGDGRIDGTGCSPKRSQISPVMLSVVLILAFLALVIGATTVYSCIHKRKLNKLREQFFQQNGGLLMKQKLSSVDGSVDGTNAKSSNFFSAEVLKKATNNYAENQILGRGGYGVVYKGILPNKQVVAIKKSRVMDANQVDQFIHEMFILTQVNHRNVVKLLGCCFESEVPELVYEYVPNGTLHDHIHKTLSWLTLDQRLRIAVEAAGALSYLHSAASIPIIHRDVKSANILLDENYVAKMADFGASRLVPLDQTQVTTLVQGTLGYLDPEYFHSSQLTEKSDVYSFGVVLAELLTAKKPICVDRSLEERNLAIYFLVSMKENRLFEIVEPRLVTEGTLEQLQAFAELVKRCLCLKGEERPTMKEVVIELEGLRKYKKDPRDHRRINEEGEISLVNQETQADTHIELMSLSTDESSTTGRYGFDYSTMFPLKSAR